MNRLKNKKLYLLPLFSLLFTFMQIAGWQLSMKYHTSVHTSALFQRIGVLTIPQCFFVGIIEFIFWIFILYTLLRFTEKHSHGTEQSERNTIHFRPWLTLCGLLFLCWIPFLLGCFPGLYNYDIGKQMEPILYEIPMSTHHPILHTLLAGGIIKLGYLITGEHLTAGVLLHSLCQMLVCSGFFSYFVLYIWSLTGRKKAAVLAFLYYAFFPLIAMSAMSTTKDILCSVLLQMCAMFLYDLTFSSENIFSSNKKMACFSAVIALCCLFRNNVIYAIIVFCILCALIYRKKAKRILLSLGCGILIYLLVNTCLIYATNANKGSMAEAFSVPMQQLARLYNEKGETAFTPEETELLTAAVPKDFLKNYNPFLADYIKNYTNFDMVKDRSDEYISLWLHKGVFYPGVYIASFLDNTYQAWYPGTSVDTDPWKNDYTDYYDVKGWPAITIRPLIPFVYTICREIGRGFTYQKIPVLRLLFSVGFMFWIMLYTLLYGLIRKEQGTVLAQILILLFCFTMFLGPVSLVRYYLVLFYGFPVCAAVITK